MEKNIPIFIRHRSIKPTPIEVYKKKLLEYLPTFLQMDKNKIKIILRSSHNTHK